MRERLGLANDPKPVYEFNRVQFASLLWSVLLWLLTSNPSTAEIVPDTTLPINSTVTSQDSIKVIEGGTFKGNNLFHSFREFSISGETAFFNNDSAVRNIITRVTGGLPSNIDGTIRANDTANLLLSANPSFDQQ